jgi:hypothetical protein
MNSPLEQKVQQQYFGYKVADGHRHLAEEQLKLGEEFRGELRARSEARAREMGRLASSEVQHPISQAYLADSNRSRAEFMQELDDEQQVEVDKVRSTTQARDKVVKQAAKFYNRPWNKGRIQEMAVRDANQAGVDVTFGGVTYPGFPPEQGTDSRSVAHGPDPQFIPELVASERAVRQPVLPNDK